jgi:hypothetical protein
VVVEEEEEVEGPGEGDDDDDEDSDVEIMFGDLGPSSSVAERGGKEEAGAGAGEAGAGEAAETAAPGAASGEAPQQLVNECGPPAQALQGEPALVPAPQHLLPPQAYAHLMNGAEHVPAPENAQAYGVALQQQLQQHPQQQQQQPLPPPPAPQHQHQPPQPPGQQLMPPQGPYFYNPNHAAGPPQGAFESSMQMLPHMVPTGPDGAPLAPFSHPGMAPHGFPPHFNGGVFPIPGQVPPFHMDMAPPHMYQQPPRGAPQGFFPHQGGGNKFGGQHMGGGRGAGRGFRGQQGVPFQHQHQQHPHGMDAAMLGGVKAGSTPHQGGPYGSHAGYFAPPQAHGYPQHSMPPQSGGSFGGGGGSYGSFNHKKQQQGSPELGPYARGIHRGSPHSNSPPHGPMGRNGRAFVGAGRGAGRPFAPPMPGGRLGEARVQMEPDRRVEPEDGEKEERGAAGRSVVEVGDTDAEPERFASEPTMDGKSTPEERPQGAPTAEEGSREEGKGLSASVPGAVEVSPERAGDDRAEAPADALPGGLANTTGQNNCYLNVVVQSLWSLRAFRDRVCRADPATEGVGAGERVEQALRAVFEGLSELEGLGRSKDTSGAVSVDGLRQVRGALLGRRGGAPGDSPVVCVGAQVLSELAGKKAKFRAGHMDDAVEAFEDILSYLSDGEASCGVAVGRA